MWSRIGAVVYGVSQEDIAAYGRKRGTEDYKWRACLISCRLVFEKGNHDIPVIGGFLAATGYLVFMGGTRVAIGRSLIQLDSATLHDVTKMA